MNSLITSLLLISIFKNVTKNKVIKSFIGFLKCAYDDNNFDTVIEAYSKFISELYSEAGNQNLYTYLKQLIYTDNNIISRGCGACAEENSRLLETGAYELSVFDKLVLIDYKNIKNMILDKYPDKTKIIEHLPVFFTSGIRPFNIDDVISSYQKYGYGIFACYNAFKFTKEKEIKPIKYYDNLAFSDLKNYAYQKEVIKKNTQAFLDGKEANNILLYGDRGCGKSSTVKALINEFSGYNLKIIQIYKESIIHLADLYETLRNLPAKFIIFADDVSFEEDDTNFSSIKAVLEGSLSDRPKNIIIYATTNRMHLVKESFSSREGNEIHYGDTIDETVSMSDRFGITLTFSILTKSEYLDIVSQIADDCCITVNDKFYKQAEEFSALKGIRTPRTARQFITNYLASL